MSARPESDGGLGYLEQKLGLFVHGPSQVRRNAALDILTGRAADARLPTPDASTPHAAHPTPPTKRPPVPVPPTRTHQSVAYRNVRALRAIGVALPDVEWTSNVSVSPWLAARDLRRARLRIEPQTQAAPARRAFLRPVLLASILAGVVLTASFGARGFTERAVVEDSAVILVDPVAEAIAPITPAATNDEAFPASESANSIQATPTPIFVDERFTSNARGWPNDPQATAWLAGGAYRLAARTPKQFVAVAIPGTPGLADNVVTGTFHKVGGPGGGGYGLILRDQNPELRDGRNQFGHYYVFEVGDRGEVGVWLRDGDRWIDLLTWTASAAVKPGIASNELTVTAAGDHLSFVVNGILVASETDSVFHTGAAGVFVGGDGNEVALDRISVSSTR